MNLLTRLLSISLLLLLLAGCTNTWSNEDCPVTEPTWAKPPADSAVQGEPGYGYYYINEDSSIWASAQWSQEEGSLWRANPEGIKVGWFRPAGATLEIKGQRQDGRAPPLEAEASCCYPTQFQASGLYFPTEGCWEVTAKAEDKELAFVVWVDPETGDEGFDP